MFRIILILIFLPAAIFAQTNSIVTHNHLSVDSTGEISICLSDSADQIVYLECFRWNKWVKMDSISRKINDRDTCIFKKSDNYSVEEQFRLENIFPDGSKNNTKIAKRINPSADTCQKLVGGHCGSSYIRLVCPSKWEIYDSNGKIIKRGDSSEIFIGDLPQGDYFLNYGNSTAKFFTYGHQKKKR